MEAEVGVWGEPSGVEELRAARGELMGELGVRFIKWAKGLLY